MRQDTPSQLVLGRLAATALSFVTGPLIARSIGAEGRGETAAVLALFYLVPILVGLGVPLEVRRVAASTRTGAVIRGARILSLFAVAPSLLFAFVLHGTLLEGLEPTTAFVAACGVASTPITILWMCDISVLVALGKFRKVIVIQILQPLFYLCCIAIIALISELTAANVLVSYLVANSVVATIGWFFTSRSDQGFSPPPSKLFKSSLKFSGSSIAEAASNRLDQAIMIPIIGSYQAGLYAVAVSITVLPTVFGQALGAAYFREVAVARQERAKILQRAIGETVAMSLVLVPISMLAVTVLVPLVFGSEFVGAILPGLVLAVASSGSVLLLVMSMLLGAQGKGWVMTSGQIGSLFMGIGALLLFGPSGGALAAAGASVLAAATGVIVLAILGRFPFRAFLLSADHLRGAIITLVKRKA